MKEERKEKKSEVGAERRKKMEGVRMHIMQLCACFPLPLPQYNNLQRHSFIRGSFNSTEVAAEERLGLREKCNPPLLLRVFKK